MASAGTPDGVDAKANSISICQQQDSFSFIEHEHKAVPKIALRSPSLVHFLFIANRLALNNGGRKNGGGGTLLMCRPSAQGMFDIQTFLHWNSHLLLLYVLFVR